MANTSDCAFSHSRFEGPSRSRLRQWCLGKGSSYDSVYNLNNDKVYKPNPHGGNSNGNIFSVPTCPNCCKSNGGNA